MKNIKKIISFFCAAGIGMTLSTAPDISLTAAESNKIVINEICAKNTSFAAPDGGFYDWIEIYNPSSKAVDLSGYGLSDKAGKPYKYIFPNNSIISGKQRLIIFCDSLNPQIDGYYTAAFGLSTNGETITLTDSQGKTVDTVTFGQMQTNISYGRIPDGSENFAFMKTTPNAPNAEKSVISVDVPEPVLSNDGGFYSDEFSLSITVPEGTTVYYTFDGSQPTVSSSMYSSPIDVSDISESENKLSEITNITSMQYIPPSKPIDKAFIINAVAVDAEGNYSDTVTASYFIGYQNRNSYYQNLKVISIVTDSDNLFDNEKGIYVEGNDYNYENKGSEWERPASIQIFDNGKLQHTQNIGIRIHGGISRVYPQKSFNIYARSKYGSSKLEFDLFSGNLISETTGKKIKKFDSFILRNGGDFSDYSRFRDKLNQTIVSDRDFLTQRMESCIVFINGEFWGRYEITERIDDDFVDAHFDVGKNNVCIIKNEKLEVGNEETLNEWSNLVCWIRSTDFSIEENYSQLCEKVDMQSFMDYVSAEIYFNNIDWGYNNTAMWKSSVVDSTNPYADGKWRFILFDTEYCQDPYDKINPPANRDSLNEFLKYNSDSFVVSLMKAAMENESFREQFCRTFMDMANNNFDYLRVSELINQFSAEYHDVIVDTYKRFRSKESDEYNAEKIFLDAVDSIDDFYQNRFTHIVDSLKIHFSLKGSLANITIRNDDSMGTVTINTITPDLTSGSWNGSYYTDFPILLNAEPKPGYTFSYWETSDDKKININSAEIEFNANLTVTAVYEKSDIIIGDINVDGNVNSSDLVILQKYLLGNIPLTAEQAARADIYADEVIDVFDMVLLRKSCLNQK
ncbi:MAG: CotH kinase family protein [Ruminococcus sp.]|nr:CotH kinase family protein [Ruminococcus sp.]